MTQLAAALRAATAELARAGVPSARHDAEALAAYVLGVLRSELVRLDAIDEHAFGELVAARARRVPLQHLTGSAPFRHIELAVGPGGFVPRPETEVVAGFAIEKAAMLPAPVVVDLCAGPGAIALSIAHELPHAEVHAVELDPAAFAWLQRNIAARAPDENRVNAHLADAADALPELDGTVDVVVSNPPYIPADARPIDPEVALHDPPLALYGGEDGLDVVRVVIGAALRLLRPGGWLVVEHADTQGRSVPRLVEAAGFADVADHRDLADRPRFSTGRRAGRPQSVA
jgi:release factor glutamine methyltransferase